MGAERDRRRRDLALAEGQAASGFLRASAFTVAESAVLVLPPCRLLDRREV